ncbi:MAG: hypothetical protein ACQESR_29690 [Planctomycetota bacterium]
MEQCPTQAVLPLVGLAAEKVIRDRYNPSDKPRALGRRPAAPIMRQLLIFRR